MGIQYHSSNCCSYRLLSGLKTYLPLRRLGVGTYSVADHDQLTRDFDPSHDSDHQNKSKEEDSGSDSSCVGYLVTGAGSAGANGCYKQKHGGSAQPAAAAPIWVLDATHQLYSWHGQWHIGDNGKSVSYASLSAATPPESSGGCGAVWKAVQGREPW
jgi:hypothetical protein